MVVHTENCHLDSDLTLHDRTQSPLTIRALTLTLTTQNDELIECRLTFQVSPQLYQRIDTEALFNLKPEVRGSLSAGDFQPEPDITIEASLQPDLLPRLVEHAADVNQAAIYILTLSLEQPDDPLLSTENWFGLSLKQPIESGETGYSTFWAYISPSSIAQAATSSEQIAQAIANFFKQWSESNLAAVTQDAITEMFAGIDKFVKELAQVTQEATPDTTPRKPIWEEIVNFFQADNWPFIQIEGKPILQMAFLGENGKWTCYANARVELEQFVFYSICPVNVPEHKQQAIADFLTRANSGMIIGNFELNIANGEIRYKTSIDVKGSSLTSTLIKQMVYANVMMMDSYLPGMMSVIYGNVLPLDAIAQIEGQS